VVTLLFAIVAQLQVATAARVELVSKTDRLVTGQAITVQLQVHDGEVRRPPTLVTGRGLDASYVGSRQTIKSQNFQRFVQIQSYEYRVTAMEEGAWTIGPMEITLSDGTVLGVSPLTLTVTERVEGVDGPEMSAIAGFAGTEAWVGETVVYTFRGQSRSAVPDVTWTLPDFDGMRDPTDGALDGREYVVDDPDGAFSVSEGWKPLLVTRPGDLRFGGALAQFGIREGRNSWGFVQRRVERRVTDPLSVLAKPLPPAPDGFSGLVGDFQLESSFGRTQAAVGQSVPWVLEFVGDGTLEGLTWELPEVDGATVYEGSFDSTARIQDGRYVAFGRFEHVLVPTRPGELQPPPSNWIVFSPTLGEYVTKTLEHPVLRVSGAAEDVAEVESFGQAPSLDDLSDALALRELKQGGRARAWQASVWLPWLLGVLGLPGLWWLGTDGLVMWKARPRRTSEAELPASPVDLLESLPEDPVLCAARLDEALRRALADRVGHPGEGLRRAELLSALQDSGRHSAIGELFFGLDRVRFAAEPLGDELKGRVVQVVRELCQ
jgi:hypothetical protein